MYLNSDKSDDEDSIPEGDGDSVSEDGESDLEEQNTDNEQATNIETKVNCPRIEGLFIYESDMTEGWESD